MRSTSSDNESERPGGIARGAGDVGSKAPGGAGRLGMAVPASDERVALALDAAGLGSFVWYPEEDRGEPDERMLALFGLPADGTLDLATALARLIHPDDIARYADAVARATDPLGDGALNEEIRIVRLDGEERWIAVTARTVFGGDPPRALRMPGVAADVTARKQAEDAVRVSEDRFRTIFSAMDEGFALCEMIVDDDGRGVDYRILEVNPASERMVGLSAAEVLGKTILEVVPDIDPEWIRMCACAALERKPVSVERYFEVFDRWIEVNLIPYGRPDDRQFASLYTDVSDRKRAEETLNASAERDTFRVALSDALRALADPVAIQCEASRLLREHLRASRVLYTEVDDDELHSSIPRGDAPGAVGLVGSHRLDKVGPTLLERMRAGRSAILGDVAGDELTDDERAVWDSLGVRAILAVPLIKSGRFVSFLGVYKAQPHGWTETEIATVEDTAERTWAALERARAQSALHASEERLRLATSAADIYNWEIDLVSDRFEASDNAAGVLGFPMPATLEAAFAVVHPSDLPRVAEDMRRAFAECGEFAFEYRIAETVVADEVWASTAGVAISGVPGGPATRVVGVTQNITKRKQAERALQEWVLAQRRARADAELIADLGSELEAIEGVHARAHRLVGLLVPRIAEYAAVELPDQRLPIAEAGSGEPTTDVVLSLGLQASGMLRLRLHDPDAELALVEQVAARASVLLANARIHEAEHQIALRLQRALLPDRLLESASIAIAARYEAGSAGLEVGGDWYDSFELSDGRVGLVVGDVVGHGLDAAAAMGRMRTALAALAPHADNPGHLLSRLDEFANGPNGTEFATACVATFDPSSRVLEYASAGHPPMLLVSDLGEPMWLDDGRSVPLGIGRSTPRGHASLTIAAGTTLVLYSDGLVERRRQTLRVGLDALEQVAVAHHDAPVEALCERILAELGGGTDDDIVVMVARCAPTGAFRYRFRAAPEELRYGRVAVRAWLDEHDISASDRADVLLALGEACANAVEHAYREQRPGDLEIEMVLDNDLLLAEVRDFGRWRDSSRDETARNRGRGTAIMEAVAERFTRRSSPAGTTVSLQLRVGRELT